MFDEKTLHKPLWFPKNKLKGLSVHLNSTTFFFRLETFSEHSATCPNNLPPLSSLFLCPQFTSIQPSWKFNLLSRLFGWELSRCGHTQSLVRNDHRSFWRSDSGVKGENWWMSSDLMRNEMHKVKLLLIFRSFPPFRRHHTSPSIMIPRKPNKAWHRIIFAASTNVQFFIPFLCSPHGIVRATTMGRLSSVSIQNKCRCFVMFLPLRQWRGKRCFTLHVALRRSLEQRLDGCLSLWYWAVVSLLRAGFLHFYESRQP